eukprot:GFUD01037532.1.p1 GENE.GFUD01037532.1~~GFUD01037532.1.p1  ORF type:complete len:735 (-),score=126.35 GFUD01037532.1:88-2292(-)
MFNTLLLIVCYGFSSTHARKGFVPWKQSFSNGMQQYFLSGNQYKITRAQDYFATWMHPYLLPRHQLGRASTTTYTKYSHREMTSFDEVKDDIKSLLTDSKEFWPADYGNYGPLLIRLAWHSAGTYRASDGRGGGNGARQRFEPERSWADNTNLDKARTLLLPIKQKYGHALSWGDLIILAGDTAIESMGGPILGFCGGRVDDVDGSDSAMLGPTTEQKTLMPCPVNGTCKSPLGTSTVGLIYVNPEGPMGVPVPKKSSIDIRDVFGRMNMNDTETVALIGGGHSFGKTHGACPAGAGKSPKEDPENPWSGLCGSGKGNDTFTSGFEFPWTTNPTVWDNEFFKNLLAFEWQIYKGPGSHFQWTMKGNHRPVAPSVDGKRKQTIGMLTTDLALIHDDSYLKIVKTFASDLGAFDHAFAHAWYKLTTRDMGPVTRCVGDNIPPAQPWQYPLPSTPENLPNFKSVRKDIRKILNRNQKSIGAFVRLAWQCISTFRSTDYLGGCNGARIRFSPQKDWSVSKNLNKALYLLSPVKEKFGESLSWADLIVLTGNTAIEKSGGNRMKFCGGRTDAKDGEGSTNLEPKITGDFHDSLPQFKEFIKLLGLTQNEFAVINAAGYAIGDTNSCDGLFCKRDFKETVSAIKDAKYNIISNIFFKILEQEKWSEYTVQDPFPKKLYKANGSPIFMFSTDLMFKDDPDLKAVAQNYIDDNDRFLDDFAAAWTKLSNSDRFDGPTGNICH